jgi:hypothetical protein
VAHLLITYAAELLSHTEYHTVRLHLYNNLIRQYLTRHVYARQASLGKMSGLHATFEAAYALMVLSLRDLSGMSMTSIYTSCRSCSCWTPRSLTAIL